MWDTGAPNLHRLPADYLNQPANPFNDFEPVDSSAAAIAAQGFIRLGNHLVSRGGGKKASRYRQAGLTIARALFSEPYLSQDLKHQGLLLHSVYHRPNGWDYIAPGQKVPNGESSLMGRLSFARTRAADFARSSRPGLPHVFLIAQNEPSALPFSKNLYARNIQADPNPVAQDGGRLPQARFVARHRTSLRGRHCHRERFAAHRAGGWRHHQRQAHRQSLGGSSDGGLGRHNHRRRHRRSATAMAAFRRERRRSLSAAARRWLCARTAVPIPINSSSSSGTKKNWPDSGKSCCTRTATVSAQPTTWS